MEKMQMESPRLLIEVQQRGAELVRIYDKNKKQEVLWHGDPAVWGRCAPLLFPFVGKCFENQYVHKGDIYPMSQHGFARDMDFVCVSANDNEICCRLTDTDETKKVYPFPFVLDVFHRLKDNQLTVMWRVENQGQDAMFFMIGGHPAFVTPDGFNVHDFTLEFSSLKDGRLCRPASLHYEAPNEQGYAEASKSGNLTLDRGKVLVKPGFFKQTLTYMFDQAQVDRVSLLLPGQEPYVTLHCSGFPYLAVWTMEETHPFMCLEPWFGRCADMGFTEELDQRTGICRLEPGQIFQKSYVIEIH